MEVIGNRSSGIEAEVCVQLKPIGGYRNSGHSELRGYTKGHCFAGRCWGLCWSNSESCDHKTNKLNTGLLVQLVRREFR
jgi:hypothetical protein